MDKTPFFSIIIPTLNEEKYLPRLLTALAGQTYTDFEVIIVDGRSEDKTTEEAKKFSARLKNLRIITSDKRNLPYQRNLGAQNAPGTFFVFFDADVLIPPEFLEGIHYTIISRKCTFVTTWFTTDSKNSSDEMLILVINLAIEMSNVIGKPLSHGPNTIVKREAFFKVNGYKENLKMAEDHDFTMRVCREGYDLVILKEPQSILSLRRFASQGRLKVLYTWWWSALHTLLIGPQTTDLFHYKMGGHVHVKSSKLKTQNSKLKMYYHMIERFEQKLKRFFSDI